MYNKNNQNKEDEERFAWTTAKKTEQQPLDQSNENLKNQQNVQIKKYYSAQKPQPQSPELTNLSKQREMISGTNPTKTRNQVITNKDQSNVSMTQSNLNNQNYQELAKNNNFNDNEEYKKQQQIMMGSTAQSFYASNTQNKFQKSTVQSNNRHQFDIFRYSNNGFGHSIPKQKCVLDSNSNSKFQTEFISFLQDLLQISEIDKNIESAKLEFLGLINFSISNLFDYIDKQKKNTIVYEEFKNFIQSELSLKCFSSNECNIIFQHFDLQSRGMISKEDLKNKLKPLDPFIVFQQPYLIILLLSEAEKQKLKNYFKAILSGHSKINEIKKHYSNRNARTFNSLSLSELFNKLDHDNDSCISLYDVQNVFEEENIKITKDNINHIFQRFDKPNLTPITFSDFIKEFSSHKI